MQLVENIFLRGNEKAVLFLHSYTSNAKEMQYLAKELHEEGYTCYAPNLVGHGATPGHLFASSIEKVAAGSREAVNYLIEQKYETIYLIGQSLGGVLSIRLANEFPQIKAVCIISSPILERPTAELEKRAAHFSKRYLKNNGRTEQEIQEFMSEHFPRPIEKFNAFQQFIVQSEKEVHVLKQPLFLAKGGLDEVVFHKSIDLIEQKVNRNIICKKLYKNSGHLISLGKERDLLAEDILDFLNKIEKRTV